MKTFITLCCLITIGITTNNYARAPFPFSLNSFNNQNFQIYPNPAKEKVTLSYNLDFKTNVTIQIYSRQGELVFTENIQNVIGHQTTNIDISDLKKETYLVNLSYENEKYLFSQKLIVK